ncbi:MAG TPA: DUF58 domain-containing protein [Phycisphaerae bacterium]|nr:DUF58 domain-containing protein [Phycisphaerae bacterium]
MNAIPTQRLMMRERLLVTVTYRFFCSLLGGLVLCSIVSAICGAVLRPIGFVWCAGFVSLIALGIAFPWISVRFARAELDFAQERTEAGQPAAARLHVRNRLPFALWALRLRIDATDSGMLDVTCNTVPPWSTTLFSWEITPPVRGVYPRAPVTLSCQFPFGLYEASRHVPTKTPLIVWPRTVPIEALPDFRQTIHAQGPHRHHLQGPSDDFRGVRDYGPGDGLRSVHWKQSARLERLVVREREAETLPRVQIVLHHSPCAAPDAFERVLSIGASVIRQAMARGASVEVVTPDSCFLQGGGPRHLRTILDKLAHLLPSPGSPLSIFLATPACAQFRQGLRIVVTNTAPVASYGAANFAQHVIAVNTKADTRGPLAKAG